MSSLCLPFPLENGKGCCCARFLSSSYPISVLGAKKGGGFGYLTGREYLVQFLAHRFATDFLRQQTKATGAVFHSWKPRWKRHLEGSGGETTEALFISVKGQFSRGREVPWAVQGGPVLGANADLVENPASREF